MSTDNPTTQPSERQQPNSASNLLPSSTMMPGAPVYEYRLPERIPEGWLADLKNAIRESRTKLIVTTILSSSLLTGVLTTVGNYYLDKHRAQLEISRDSTKEVLGTYNTLGNDIQELESRVIAARVISSRAVADSSEENQGKAIEEISALSNQIAVVQNRVKHQDIDNGKGTRELVEKWLTPLGEKLAMAQKNPASREILNDLIATLENLKKQGIPEIRNHINSVKKSLKESLSG